MLQLFRSALQNGNYDLTSLLLYFLAALITVFLAMPIHEWAHAFTAVKLGDPTPKYHGRLKLSPFAHIDWVGALLIMLFGFGYAKPVPVNNRNFKNPKAGMALTALAGPVSNILLAFVCYVLLKVLPVSSAIFVYVAIFLQFVITINISLATFNLIPIPPLDGSRLLAAFLPDRTYYKLMQYERYFLLLMVLLLFSGFLDLPLSYIRAGIYRLFEWLTFFL